MRLLQILYYVPVIVADDYYTHTHVMISFILKNKFLYGKSIHVGPRWHAQHNLMHYTAQIARLHMCDISTLTFIHSLKSQNVTFRRSTPHGVIIRFCDQIIIFLLKSMLCLRFETFPINTAQIKRPTVNELHGTITTIHALILL